MKALLAIAVLVLVTGCYDKERMDKIIWQEHQPYVQYVKGHAYVIMKSHGRGGGPSILHAAHCPCQDTTKGTSK